MPSDPLTAYPDDPTGNGAHHPYTAFNQGYDAAEIGHIPEKNPYPAGTGPHRAWYDGWCCFNDDGGADDEGADR